MCEQNDIATRRNTRDFVLTVMSRVDLRAAASDKTNRAILQSAVSCDTPSKRIPSTSFHSAERTNHRCLLKLRICLCVESFESRQIRPRPVIAQEPPRNCSNVVRL